MGSFWTDFLGIIFGRFFLNIFGRMFLNMFLEGCLMVFGVFF